MHDPIRLPARANVRHVLRVAAIGLASVLGYALGLAAAAGLGSMISAASARPAPRADSSPSAGAFDASRFILNGLLVPALDADALPLRFVDPLPALRCRPGASVRVNGSSLRAGALVPDAPFELDWRTDDCHPFGAAGPRFDGKVKLTVFREDWGFSAVVEPAGLSVSAAGRIIPIRARTARFPQCIDGEGPVRAGTVATSRSACL